MTSPLMTALQVAEILAISEDQVKRRTKADEWPCVKLSTHTIRYRPEDVEAIIGRYAVAGEAPRAGISGQTARSRARNS
ncbi:hypothetical protein GCM10022234_35930 [Aeromicrobium panaciterrae]|uniref:helix-turn-helix transcriptional regulator n=1 Tax=Aeromicrobium panaciterrae TaxID=363861 RepID=UPI0031DCC4FC